MRFLEILMALSLAIYVLWPLTRRLRPTAVNMMPTFALLCMLTHLNIEGSRWQMSLIYFLTPAMFLFSVPSFSRSKTPTLPSLKITFASLALLTVATALPALLPVPAVIPPTGPYQVGTTTYVLVDENRKEIYSGKDEPRKFMIQIWYPAIATPESKHAPWMQNADLIAPAIAHDLLEFPSFFLDHLTLSTSNSWQDADADPSGGPYPVLFFSHGWQSFRAQNTYQFQELASNGYIVVSLEHTYGSVLTVFPDGTQAPNNPNALPNADLYSNEEYEKIARVLVNQWSGDIEFANRYMAELNENDPTGRFTKLLDLEKTGVFGHSTGGGAAVEFCGTHPACKAVFLMDPFLRPVSSEVLNNGIPQPAFYFFSQNWADNRESRNNALLKESYPHNQQAYPVVTILGTKHYDFSDLPALSPLAPLLGLKGPINGVRVQRIINDYTLAFFNLHLKNEPTDLFNGPSAEYPELRWETIQ